MTVSFEVNWIYCMLSGILFMISSNLKAQNNAFFLDTFSQISYTENNGTAFWNEGWIETDIGGTDPAAGRIQVSNNQLSFKDANGNNGNFDSFIYRRANLSGYESAVLTLDYNRVNGDENIGIWLLDSLGNFVSFGTLPIDTSNPGTYTLTIPTAYLHADFGIAFNSANTSDWDKDEQIFLDNIQIEAVEPVEDTDGDGISDVSDIDNDNDGIPDCFENGAENTIIGDVFSINGDANQIGPLEAQLTAEVNDQSGSMTINERINFDNSFSFNFEAFLGNKNGADGIAIIFHNDPAGASAVGDNGVGLGAKGIQDGIVLELDTFFNEAFGVGDISDDHGMIWDSDMQTGAGLLTNALSIGEIEDGNWHEVSILWNSLSQTISYFVDGILAGRFQGDLVTNYFGGQNLVYFGFSASTGALSNDQRIRFNDLCDIPLFVDSDNDGIPNYLDLDSDNDGILDVVEGGDNIFDTNSDGRIDSNDSGYADNNNDGQSDNSVDTIENPNTDGTDEPDFIDVDSDNDTCFDALEASGNFSGSQIQENGQLNAAVNTDGIPIVVVPAGQATTTAVVTVGSTTIDTQPSNQNFNNGSNVSFSANVTGNATLSYQWQQSTDNGTNWIDLSNGGSNPAISGAITNTLQLSNTPISYNGYQYRVIIINEYSECIENNSDMATLIISVNTIITNRRITYRVTPPLPPTTEDP